MSFTAVSENSKILIHFVLYYLFIYLLSLPDNINSLLSFYIYLSKIWIKDVRCHESLLLANSNILSYFNPEEFILATAKLLLWLLTTSIVVLFLKKKLFGCRSIRFYEI